MCVCLNASVCVSFHVSLGGCCIFVCVCPCAFMSDASVVYSSVTSAMYRMSVNGVPMPVHCVYMDVCMCVRVTIHSQMGEDLGEPIIHPPIYEANPGC